MCILPPSTNKDPFSDLLQKYIATPHKIAVKPLVDPGFNRGGGGRIFSEISSEINVTVQTKQAKMGVDLGRGCFSYRNDNVKRHCISEHCEALLTYDAKSLEQH